MSTKHIVIISKIYNFFLDWESFKLIKNFDNSVSFLSIANGYFVSADNYGDSSLIANKQINNQWERFFLTPNPDNSYTIESQASWKFLCADDSGNKPLIANRAKTSSWESFEINYNQNSSLSKATTIPVEFWLSDTINNKMFLKQTPLNLKQDSGSNPITIFINENIFYQTIDGFGASLTDSSTWLLKNQLSDSKRNETLQNLFGKNGIGLSLLRQPIGSTDFAWESWSFSDTYNQQDDFSLNSFSLWREDAYIRPVLNEALKIGNGRIKLFASPWSPPSWMKTGKNLFGNLGGSLRSDCYNVYADYFVKYLKENINRSSEIFAVTIQNEPFYAPNYPGMIMDETEQINFIKNNLGPKLNQANLKTKIIVHDHNYDYDGYNHANKVTSETLDYVSGAGFHHYTTEPESSILEYKKRNQNKDIWITEAGFGRWIGSGSDNDQFQTQMSELIRTCRFWSKGFIMWNVALDEKSHPNIIGDFNSNQGLLTIRSDVKDNVNYERGYYSLGHFSKFVDLNAVRINTNTFSDNIENVAFLNKDNTIVLVVLNKQNQLRKIKIKWRNLSFEADLPPLAAASFKFLMI